MDREIKEERRKSSAGKSRRNDDDGSVGLGVAIPIKPIS